MKMRKTHRLLINVSMLFLVLLMIYPMSVLASAEKETVNNNLFPENKVDLTEKEEQYQKEHQTIVMAADASWRPLEYLDEGMYSGVIAEITEKLESYTGFQIEYMIFNSYEEALEAVQSGKANIISGLANDQDMAKEYNVNLTVPYLTINNAVVSNKELKNLYQSTKHKKIAVVAGDYANDDVEKIISNSELIECSSNAECLEMVRNNEVDMAVIASYCAEYYLSIPKYSGFQNYLMPDCNWDISFGINKNADPILVSILNKGIGAMSQVDINNSVYKGIIEAEYDNDILIFIYKQPLLVIGIVLLIVFAISASIIVVIIVRKRGKKRELQNGVRLKLALERTHLCIWAFDITSKRIIQVDNEREKHGFYELRENIPESVIEKGFIHPDDVLLVRDTLKRVMSGEQDVQGCWRVKEKVSDSNDPSYWWEQVLFHIVYDEHHRPINAIGVSEDVTIEKNSQRDSLTSVYNRESFKQKATNVLIEKRNYYSQCAFLILDLDGFKQINDTYGHGTGDSVLVSVGATLNKTFRTTDIVGRLGGDEFTVFITSIGKKEDVMNKAAQLVTNVNKISENEGYPFVISCSVGVAIGTNTQEDFSAMYKKADLALYEAKNAGKNTYKIYNSEKKKKILIVDDIEVNRAVLKVNLEAEYEILEAENGVIALKILNEEENISMVITDIVMPEMDGMELIKQIHANKELRNISIIAETQYGDQKQEEGVLALGVDDFIYKVASPEVIQIRVRNVMKARELK